MHTVEEYWERLTEAGAAVKEQIRNTAKRDPGIDRFQLFDLEQAAYPDFEC